MIIGDHALPGKYAKAFRQKLDEAVLGRLIACGKLEPYSEEWELVYHESSKPVWDVRDEAKAVLWDSYKAVWGHNASGSYFLPQAMLTREEHMAIYRVSQKLALAAQKTKQ